MSKIYEALLRAEQDRAEQDRAAKGNAPSAQPAQVSAQPIAYAPQATAPAPRTIYSAPAQVVPVHGVSAYVPPLHAVPFQADPFQADPFQADPFQADPFQADSAYVPPLHAAPIQVAPLQVTPLQVVEPASLNVAPPSDLPVPPDDSYFDPDKVRRYRWSPTMAALPALEDRGSAVEQFRSLRSRMFEFRDLNKLKSIMISSGVPQEGKSFVAMNLAISFARHKASRVLLIDGDMRRSTLHKLLGASGEVGLAEYLSGAAGLFDTMQQFEPAEEDSLAKLGLSSLTFIPGGSDSEKAADLSGNPRFAQLMERVTPFYDWIIVDSAPVNVVADGVNLARACDGVLLVARGGVTRYEVAQRAMTELKASNVLGFVLNAVESMPLTGSYYGYESYDSVQK